MNWNDLRLRVRALTRRDVVEQELREELDFHLEMEARKNRDAGLDARDAALQARVHFGGAAQVEEQCRDARRVGLIASTWQDVRYALRGFRRSPAFVLTVVATISLGLGLNTALFTIFNATYFRTLPVADPHSLYEFSWMDRTGRGHDYSWQQYREFLAQNPAFSAAVGYEFVDVRLDGRSVSGLLVTGEYFKMLGVGATLGRTLLPEDAAAPGRDPVIVLSHEAWQNHFSGDAGIVGRKVLLRGFPFEVVGVASPGFHGLASRPAEFWAPVTMASRFVSGPDLFGPEQPRSLSIVGRLRSEFSAGQAQSGLTLWAQRFTADEPASSRAMGTTLVSRASAKPLNLKNLLIFSPIATAFGLVLLIACANVANLMLARALSRQREIGIRLSLGAGRKRLIRQLLTESLLLAVPAGVAGFAVSQVTMAVGMRVLLAALPPGVADVAARIPAYTPDVRVFLFSLAAAALCSLCFGLVPALQATRSSVMQAARGEFGSDFRPRRLRNSLVIGQVTVCVLLLITAGILLRGSKEIERADQRLSKRDSVEIAIQDQSRSRVLDGLAAEPGIESIAAADGAPVGWRAYTAVTPAEGGMTVQTITNRVSPEFFPQFEIPILRGRNFSREESRAGAAVAVISETTARRFWPRQEAVGRTLQLKAANGAAAVRYPSVTVIGVARDELSRWVLDGQDPDMVYLPAHPGMAGTELFVQVRGDADAARRKIELDLSAADANAIVQIRKFQIRAWVAEEAFTFRVASWLSSAIGTLALFLTLSGIYGVLSYLVSQRTKEIGIRMAMGATPRLVTGMVLRQSLRLGAFGCAIGGVLALGVSKLLASVLVVTNTFHLYPYAGGVLVVLAVCSAAAVFPCYRAARVDPTTTLRYD